MCGLGDEEDDARDGKASQCTEDGDLAPGDVLQLECRIAPDDVVRTGDQQGRADGEGRDDEVADHCCHEDRSFERRYGAGYPTRLMGRAARDRGRGDRLAARATAPAATGTFAYLRLHRANARLRSCDWM